MMSKPLLFLALLAAASSVQAEEIKLTNPSFEDGLDGWTIIKADRGKSNLSTEAAHSGKAGVEVIDDDNVDGSEMLSDPLPAAPGRTYKVSFWGRNLEGEGMGVYFLFYGSDRKPLTRPKTPAFTLPASGDWKEYEHEDQAPEGAEFVAIRLHSYGKATVKAHLDDFKLTEQR